MDIDRLDIVISAEASKAEKQLNKLMSSLEKLSTVLGGINTSGLNDMANGVQQLSSFVKGMGTVKSSDFNKLRDNIQKICGLKAGNMPQISAGLMGISVAMSAFSGMNFNDNGVNKTINALNRLLSVDLSKFSSSEFGKITRAISSLGSIPDVSNSINRFISSLAKLSGTGGSIGNVAAELPQLATALKDSVSKMSKAKDISASVNMFVQSIARLANAGGKTDKTAAGLGNLAKETLKFFAVMQRAPKISENTLRMTEALSRLAAAGGKVGTASSSVQTAFSKMSSLTGKAMGAIGHAANGIVSSFKNIVNSSRHLTTASFNLKTLLQSALIYKGAQNLGRFGKSALELGSDITEVENVVDVAFGNMSKKAYDFADIATEKFGLSELAAKTYAGTMMAMLKSSGVMQRTAAEMSTTLAGLAGDIASFYNISTDDAFEKIRAGIAGQVMPLRQLGVNMTVANLEAYALAQGITKSYNAMSQAEKTILRYNYLLSVTGNQQGDFARTAGTWANQTRLLDLNFRSLKATFGQGLISAILPGVKALNLLLAKLMQVAEAFRRFMYTLMGKKLEGSQSGIVNDLSGLEDVSTGLDGVADAGNNATGGLDNATDSAKKLKKSLSVLPFDEINKLNEAAANMANNASGGSGIENLNVPSFGDLDDAINEFKNSDIEGEINKWAKKIRKAFLDEDWERLGLIIADGINKGVQKLYDVINWDNVGPKITKFTDAFTRTFNSLADNINWNLLGHTVGAGFNTIVNTLNQLIEGINWRNLGTDFAKGIEGLVDEVDWSNFGNLLGNKFMIVWDVFYGFVDNLPYAKLGVAFAELLNGVFEEISFSDIAHVLTTGINGAFVSLANFTETFNWQEFTDNVASGISTFLSDMDWKENGEALGNFLSHLCAALKGSITKDTFYELGKGIGEFLGKLPWKDLLLTAGQLIIDGLSGVFDGLEESGTAGQIAAFLGKAFIAVKIADITGIGTLVGKLIGHLAGSIRDQKNINAMSEAFKKVIGDGAQGAADTLGEFGDAAEKASGKTGTLSTILSSTGIQLGTAIAAIVYGGVKLNEFADAANGGNGKLSELGGIMDSIRTNFAPGLSQEIFNLKESLEDSGASSDEFKEKFIELFTNAEVSAESLQTAFDSLAGNINVTAEQEKLFKEIIDGVAASTENMGAKAQESGIQAETAYQSIKDSLVVLQQEGIIPSQEHMDGLTLALDTARSSGEGAQGMFKAVSEEMGNMSLDSAELEGVLKKKLPSAFKTAATAATISTGNMKTSVVESMASMDQKVATSTSNIQRNTESSISKTEATVTKATGNIATTSNKDWTASHAAVTQSLNIMKGESSAGMCQVFKNVESYMTSIYNIITNKFEWAGQKACQEIESWNSSFSTSIDSAISVFNGLGYRIAQSMGDLYNIGRNAAQSFANGMSSVHIPTPHISVDSSTWRNGNGYSYRMNSSVRWYGNGGFPNAGEMFIANENGPEMIGKMGRKNVVANNNQIADGIKAAVVDGMMEVAMMTNSAPSDDNAPYIIDVTVKTENDEVLARAVEKGRLKRDARFKPSPTY